MIITIDGPAGAGKSTVARMLAERLGLPYLDTGAMYRAAGILAEREGIVPPYASGDGERIASLLDEHDLSFDARPEGFRVVLDGEDLGEAIRGLRASSLASAVSALSAVRRALVPLQRKAGEAAGGVAEGRDVGSVVFPGATLKVFLTASPEVRARRRLKDLEERGESSSLEEVLKRQRERDLRDTTRADSPLMVPPGALVLDSTGLSPEQVVARILARMADLGISLLDSTQRDPVKSRNDGRLAREDRASIEEERI
ncbi:MAG: (d)CMP kinase [Acidobacteria bacterium]|nr:(d)CMP kinase [Acidobacteriota bacterium]